MALPVKKVDVRLADDDSGCETPQQQTKLVTARLLEYSGRRTPWQRRLWNPGMVTVLQELLEAVEFLGDGHLRPKSVGDLAHRAEIRAGKDLGIGSPSFRAGLTRCLKKIHEDALGRHKLEHFIQTISPGYLRRWREAIADNPGAISPERASRVLAGHLLGLGFSPERLHRWVWKLRSAGEVQSPLELFEAAEELSRWTRRTWEVLVPVENIERDDQVMPAQWLEPTQVSRWIAMNAAGASHRGPGGFLLRIEALDPFAAVEVASDLIESLSARIAVGKPGMVRFSVGSTAWVAGRRGEFHLDRPRRQVDIHSIAQQNSLFSIESESIDGRMRSALDLLASLETGAPGAAVAGGWAAIEAVLARSDASNIDAAHDLAALVACSFPRAELTPLAYAYRNEHADQLALEIASASTNRERCGLLADAIRSGREPEFQKPGDQACAARMVRLLADPKHELAVVMGSAEEAIRRLYRQRNLVLHAGVTNSVAMTPTLRTVPPIVGAGFDRIVHDVLTTGNREPAKLVARAHVELELCGKPGGAPPWDLLGH